MDYYQIFGISRSASQIEIKKAYRLLAKQYHPDKHQGNPQYEAKFKQINAIYETLSDSAKKSHYDQLLAIKDKHKQSEPSQSQYNRDSFKERQSSNTNNFKKSNQSQQNAFFVLVIDLLRSFMKLVLSTYITRMLFSVFIMYLIGSFFQVIYDFEVKRQERKRNEFMQESSIETGDIKFKSKDDTINVDSAASYEVSEDSENVEPKTGDIKF